MPGLKSVAPWAAVALVLAAGVYLWLGRPKGGPVVSSSSSSPVAVRAGSADDLHVGVLGAGYSDLVVLAKAKGLFDAEGLHVELSHFDNGGKVVRGVVLKEIQIGVAGEIPMALFGFQRTDYAAFATIARSEQNMLVLARKDQGVAAAADLKGKKIGIEERESALYVLDRYLKRHGLALADVTVVKMKPKQLAPALSRGEIAAIADGFPRKHPFLRRLPKAPGLDLADLSEPGVYSPELSLVASRDLLAKSPAVIEKFVRALVKANDLLTAHRDEAKAAVAQAEAIEGKRVAQAWEGVTFGVWLGPELVTAMKEEGQWFQGSGQPKSDGGMPRYEDLVYADALRAVKPDAVTLPK
jgi:NitT/TauT family transport system substrate-binding protein